MNQEITVRFEEFERYDPMTDSERVRFMAITNFGTYHAEVALYEGLSRRKQRERFKQRAIGAIEAGVMPCELSMTEH